MHIIHLRYYFNTYKRCDISSSVRLISILVLQYLRYQHRYYGSAVDHITVDIHQNAQYEYVIVCTIMSPTWRVYLFYLFIQHLLSALFTNKYALMRYLINTLQNKVLVWHRCCSALEQINLWIMNYWNAIIDKWMNKFVSMIINIIIW